MGRVLRPGTARPPKHTNPYGTVGPCPAFSCASRAALSPASWVASSLGTNVPELEDGFGEGLAAEAVSMVAPYSTAPPTPPTSIDPAMAAAATVLRTPITAFPPVVGSLRMSVAT